MAFLMMYINMKANKNKPNPIIEVPKYVRTSAKAMSFVSDRWAVRFAYKLFVTPARFPMPAREEGMDTFSVKFPMVLPESHKDILVYEYGEGQKTALLVHGWSGRGTQLFSIANLLKKSGYKVISFDAPGHGKSSKNKTHLLEFMEAVTLLDDKYNGFDVIVGHSLGAVTTLNCLARGVRAKKAVAVSGGNNMVDVLEDFVKKLGLKEKISPKLQRYFEKKLHNKMEDYHVAEQARKIDIPVLLIHDKNDLDVPYQSSVDIHKAMSESTLFLTEKLGHRKILGDKNVLEEIERFLTHDNL